VQLSASQQQTFADYIDLAEGGAAALIEVNADPPRRQAAIAAIAAYEAFAIVADSIPRLRSMRQYLEATRLLSGNGEEAGRDRALIDLETECQMLSAALNPVALIGGGRKIDALEDRFQTFKSIYVQRYRLGHDHHRVELERLAPAAADTRRHLEVLDRLNAIAALGPPHGLDLGGLMTLLERRLTPCDLQGSPAPEVTPTCPRCGYLLGALSPREDLSAVFELARRALEAKLAALAQSAVARLIHQHDSGRRLEGFLKIVQAAQTDSLIRVLDDELAGYLVQLLNENALVSDDAAVVHLDTTPLPIPGSASQKAVIADLGMVSSATAPRNSDGVAANVDNATSAIVGDELGRAGRQSLRALRPRRKTLDGRIGRAGRTFKGPPDATR
jgi:hypothetical protein